MFKLFYRAPLDKTDYDYKIDIFFCIFDELFTLFPLFVGEIFEMKLFENFKILGKSPKDYFKIF